MANILRLAGKMLASEKSLEVHLVLLYIPFTN